MDRVEYSIVLGRVSLPNTPSLIPRYVQVTSVVTTMQQRKYCNNSASETKIL